MERAEIQQAIDRIKQMELCFEVLQKTVESDPAAFGRNPSVKELLHILQQYYEGGLWLQDYQLDEQHLLPKDLKRGVLSQDGIYNLLDRIREEQQ